jgi:hypothetical protein
MLLRRRQEVGRKTIVARAKLYGDAAPCLPLLSTNTGSANEANLPVDSEPAR